MFTNLTGISLTSFFVAFVIVAFHSRVRGLLFRILRTFGISVIIR